MAKFVFVTGGVVSSVGKGVCVGSIGKILKNQGFEVSLLKLDPYLNVEPGTMSPYQHGEVFVTTDGGETDLDLGHYERVVDVDLTRSSNLTAGQVYSEVISKERKGEFLGGQLLAGLKLQRSIMSQGAEKLNPVQINFDFESFGLSNFGLWSFGLCSSWLGHLFLV